MRKKVYEKEDKGKYLRRDRKRKRENGQGSERDKGEIKK